MAKKGKLELTWVGKETNPRLEPRILIEHHDKSYHAGIRRSEKDLFDNVLIKGDNLLALKALEQEFSGKIKCVYIDPPFNTGSAFEHYDDNLEHSIWLDLMSQRLTILRDLLAEDGAIAVQLDDSEAAYMKVMMDEIFGRRNYITTVTVEASTISSFRTVNLGPTQVSNFIFLYCKNKDQFTYNVPYIGSTEVDLGHFSRFIENFDDPCETWSFKSINSHIMEGMGFVAGSPNAQWNLAKAALGKSEATEIVLEKSREFALHNAYRVFETKTLQKPSKWLREHIAASREVETVVKLDRENLDPIYLYKGRQVYFLGKGLREVDGEKAIAQPVSNIWTDVPTNNLQKEGGIAFPSGKKPEFLLRRIIQMFTNSPDDIVLDSFGGSGTTGAVAHKMNRRWIMVELGNQCDSHILPRLHSVIDGTDRSGITETVSWKGGGGFRYYTLAPSLIEVDRFGMQVISKDYNPEMLSEAMCKHMGFTYAPSEAEYWNHGYSTETDFIYVTTQSLTHDTLRKISEDVGPDRTLMICCKAYSGDGQFDNLTVHKIPGIILNKCEWGHDDYSLNVQNLPMVEEEDPDADLPLFASQEGSDA